MRPESPAPLKLSRVLHARRTAVFEAFGTEAHVKRWFSPAGYTVPEARVAMHPGGVFDICMQAPNGTRHWTRGTVVEVTPESRLVIDMHVQDASEKHLFRAYTEIDLHEVLGGTRLDIVQTFTFADPAIAAPMVAGADPGWRSTLEKLEHLLIGLHSAPAETRSVVHDTFQLERHYPAPIARVWQALTDPAAKQKWFCGPPGTWELLERRMDVRPGGTEILRGRWEGSVVSSFEATYHDVLPPHRLVYSYVMHMNDRKISVSLATVQLTQTGPTTTLTVTEQGAFLDGYNDSGSRAHGTGHLLDALGASLAE